MPLAGHRKALLPKLISISVQSHQFPEQQETLITSPHCYFSRVWFRLSTSVGLFASGGAD